MYERCLNETERVLATSKDVVLPIKEVWKLLAAEGKRRSFEVPALTDFDALLEGDKRFEIISAQADPEEIELLLSVDGEDMDSNLGSLGFYPEDRVKLRRINLSGHATNGIDRLKQSEDDEEVVPFNVKGLSATKPVRAVDVKKGSEKRMPPKTTSRANSSTKMIPKKRPAKKSQPRKGKQKLSRKNR